MTKKILILGSSGFVGRSLSQLLNKHKYEIDSYSHKGLDITNLQRLDEILSNKRYDFVINAAISGQGRLLKEDSYEDFYNNMLILENLLYLKDKYEKLITFASGAGNNRNKDVNNLKEGEIKEPPVSKYSLAKYLHDRRVYNLPFVINIRIFNVFGHLEKDNRFIKSSIRKYINKENIEIWGDAYFDFFYIKDLVSLIEYYIENPPDKYEEINAVYLQKTTLLQIAEMVNSMEDYKVWINCIENNINRNYYGSGYKLAELNPPRIGLLGGIKETYNILKNEK